MIKTESEIYNLSRDSLAVNKQRPHFAFVGNPGIASRVPYKFIFEDYSNEELLQIFINLASQEGMSLENAAHSLMLDRISLVKTEENFGNE